MKFRFLAAAILLTVFMLAGCNSGNTASKDNSSGKPQSTKEEKGATNDSKANQESDSSSGNDSSTEANNSTEDNNDKPSSDDVHDQDVNKTTYKTNEEAAEAIKGYEKIEQTNVDLGHDIKAFAEGAAGHQYLSWNEGRWLIQVNYPSDPQYAIDKNVDGLGFSKKIVAYLETHYLPAPKDKGIVKINGFKDSGVTTVQWQKGKVVYEIKSTKNSPIETLEKAVEAGKNR
ncbi:hypothetical protein [Fictibacillus enclensis]|uniref:hypothetical protein n=1 Tax=Fictibacillus enclensis TaxID=1017270 RepID=UPI0024C04183|nr:hypothetical protein [Fictibacillus enclensis]WHY71777.1 hypothetical protein QNH15_22715 [Fictibacillus enclensis]